MDVNLRKRLNINSLFKRYLRDVDSVAAYLNEFYFDKRLLVYGAGFHTEELMNTNVSKNIIGVVLQENVENDYVELETGLAKIMECDLSTADFDFLVLLGYWSNAKIDGLASKNYIERCKIIAPYNDERLYLKSLSKFLDSNKLILSPHKPNMVLILTSDMKDLVSIASKELSKYFNLIKIYENTHSLYNTPKNENFSQIIHISENLLVLETLLTENPPEIVFYWMSSQDEAWKGWYIKSILRSKTKFILGTTDFFYTQVFDMQEGELMSAFGYSEEYFSINEECERNLIQSSDAIVTNFTGRFAADILKKQPSNLLFSIGFVRSEDICFVDRRMELDDIKLCYAGGISYTHAFRSHSVTTFDFIFQKILEEDIGIAVYSYFDINISPPYKVLAEKYRMFTPMGFVAPELLLYELSKYDFGLLLYNLPQEVQESHKMHMESVFQAKIITYLCAGIPVIVNKEWRILSEFVEKEGVGLCLTFEEIGSIGRIIRECDYDILKGNVKLFQKKYAFENHQERLALFCKNLIT